MNAMMPMQDLKLINWKINLKNGQSIDLNVQDGDVFDKKIAQWVNSIDSRSPRFFKCDFPSGSIWLAPSEFSMAVRSPLVPKEPKFEKVETLPVADDAVEAVVG